MIISDYLNKFVGRTAVIIGKGPTSWDFDGDQSLLSEGVFFYLNDAVNIHEKIKNKVNSVDFFLFFLDDHQAQHWLGKQKLEGVTCVAKATQSNFDKSINDVMFYPMLESENRVFRVKTRE